MVGKHERRRTGAAFAAVYRDKVNATTGRGHQCGQLLPETHIAHRGLGSDGQSAGIGEFCDKVEQAIDVSKLTVTVRTEAGFSFGDATDTRYLCCNLRSWQDTTQSRLCTLAQLDFDGTNFIGFNGLHEAVHRETSPPIAASEIGGTNLPDQFPTGLMVPRHTAFAGIVETARQRTAAVDRFNGWRTERSEAHSRNIDDRSGAERFSSQAVATEYFRKRG